MNAEEINTKGYRYYKEIRIPKLPDKAGNVGEEENVYYGKIKLDEDVVRHSGINDRRIVHNGRTIPFISRKVMGASDKGGEKNQVFFFRKKGSPTCILTS